MNKLKNRNKLFSQRSKVAVICFVLMFITIGFAALSATLGINANTIVGKIVHEVHFENVSEVEGTMEAKVPAYVDTTNRTQINFGLELTIPGQSYEFEADIVNSGTLDSMISSIDIVGMSEEAKKYLNISCTYYDGSEVKVNDALPAGSSDRIRVKLEFLYDISNEDLPPQGTSSNFSLNITFVQDPGTGVKRTKSYYFKAIKKFAPIDNMPSENVSYADGINFNLSATDPNVSMAEPMSSRAAASADDLAVSESSLIKNGYGIYTRAGTENDEYPIFYYRGDVKDNNVLFGNICWKIVRTTETGGIKLAYNGFASNGSCDINDTIVSTDETTPFNTDGTSIADVGYMYGNKYFLNSKILGQASMAISASTYYYSNSQYYFTKEKPSYTNGKYVLSNGELHTLTEFANGADTSGYYVCLGYGGNSECNTVSYIFRTSIESSNSSSGSDGVYIEYYNLTSGKELESTFITIAGGFDVNADGTYALKDNIENITIVDWYNNFTDYKYKYICLKGTLESCSRLGYIFDSTFQSMFISDIVSYIFGNDVIYDETTGKYTLSNTYTYTYEDSKTYKNIDRIDGYHYTCFTTENTCDTIYYVNSILPRHSYYGYEGEQSIFGIEINYIELTNGKKIENVQQEIFTNTNDSVVKQYLDTWYENNMRWSTPVLDQDAIWCNNRTIVNGGLLGKDSKVYGSISMFETYKNIYNPGLNLDTNEYDASLRYNPLLKDAEACPNVNDQFTVSTSNVGNKMLKYPIGLLTAHEVALSGVGYSSFLLGDSDDTYLSSRGGVGLTMTPSLYRDYAYMFGSNSSLYAGATNDSMLLSDTPTAYALRPSIGTYFVRPTIVLKNNVELTGEGTVENPYIVNLNSMLAEGNRIPQGML